ncbi:MAG TPA: hypothetical protein VFP84_24970 [Kofleriaceae bacterium]|nr:hypothetical protein [Kofleriaceae bacterium]
MGWRCVLGLVLAACATPAAKRVQAPSDPGLGEDQGGHLAHLYSELQDDILTSYDRDEPPDLDTAMIERKVGTARIGAGPNDVYIADDLAHAPSRWPLPLDRQTRSEVRSKQLAIQIAADQQAAWMSDELSWRIELCGRTTVVPLRITGLYAHDGDRWVPVFEHLSFGTTAALPSDAPPAKAIKAAVVSRDLSDELSGLVGRGLFPGQRTRDASALAQDDNAIVLGPGASDEWRASHVLEAKLPAGRDEDHRIGTVGRDPAAASVAYWIGTYLTDPGKLRLRVSYVFEKRCAPAAKADKPRSRECSWQVVQAHMSQPITDEELAHQVFGTALSSVKPLALDCADGGRAASRATPGPAAPTLRRAPAAAAPASPPATRSR